MFTYLAKLDALNPLPRLLNTRIHFIRIRALPNSRRCTRFASRLAADNGRDGSSPFGPVGASGFELLFEEKSATALIFMQGLPKLDGCTSD